MGIWSCHTNFTIMGVVKMRTITQLTVKKGKKIRLYPMIMTDEDMEYWYTNPEIVKRNLGLRINNEHLNWIPLKYRLDPNIDGIFYKGLPISQISGIDKLALVVVEVPETEDDSLFTGCRSIQWW